MNGVHITVAGNVGNDPILHTSKNGITWTQFRVASTHKWRDNTGNWVEGATMWFTVKCWDNRAANVVESLKKGMPVIVAGRLSEEPYVVTRNLDSGEPVTELRNGLTIDSATVGISLSRGKATYTRTNRNAAEPENIPGWVREKHGLQDRVEIDYDDDVFDDEEEEEGLAEVQRELAAAVA
jgi:single-strand DNA-binding protein